MIEFKEFRAVLPLLENMGKVAVMNPHLYPLEGSNPNSFYSVMMNNGELAKLQYKELFKRNILQKQKTSNFFIYQQEGSSGKFTGVIGLCSVNDLINNKILLHEKTLSNRVKKFTSYLINNPIQAEPVSLISESNELKHLINQEIITNPLVEFKKYNLIHRLWEVKNKIDFIECFKQTPQLFLADGHHRIASVLNYQELIKQKQAILSFVIPSDSVGIFPYHREIYLNELEQKAIVNYLKDKNFEKVTTLPNYLKFNQLAISFNEQLYQKTFSNDKNVFGELNKNCFKNHLENNFTKRLNYIPGEKAIPNLVKNEKGLMQVFLPNSTFQNIKQTAVLNKYLPPKSTWILPKIPTGMVIFEMS